MMLSTGAGHGNDRACAETPSGSFLQPHTASLLNNTPGCSAAQIAGYLTACATEGSANCLAHSSVACATGLSVLVWLALAGIDSFWCLAIDGQALADLMSTRAERALATVDGC